MLSRVTNSSILAHFQRTAQRHSAQVANLNIQISSGERIHRPSDDPNGMRRLLEARRATERLDSQIEAIGIARTQFQVAENNLLDANNILLRAKEIALEGRQSTDTAELGVLANEVGVLIERLAATANANYAGTYLFGGAEVLSPPYSGEGGGVGYTGASVGGSAVADVDGLTVERVVGESVLDPLERQPTVYSGTTGLAAGTGTDTARGQDEILVTHTGTTFAAGSGVQAGVSSVGGDTLIGTHTLTITDTSGTGASGVVSLNGGSEVAFTSGDTDLQVTGPNGEVIHLDTTAITAGFSGDITVTATGALSIDGGATSLPIDFSTNQALTDSETGAVTYVDSSAVSQAGTASVTYPGTNDAFEVLRQLEQDLLALKQGGTAAVGRIGARIEELELISDRVLEAAGLNAVRIQELTRVEQRAQDLQLEHARVSAEVGATDVATAALELQEAQSLLEYTLAASSRIFDFSVVNYLF